jgi:hypothetical protein
MTYNVKFSLKHNASTHTMIKNCALALESRMDLSGGQLVEALKAEYDVELELVFEEDSDSATGKTPFFLARFRDEQHYALMLLRWL